MFKTPPVLQQLIVIAQGNMLVVKALLLCLVVTWISASPSSDVYINVAINVNGVAAGDEKGGGKPGQGGGKAGCWNMVTEEMMPLWTTGYYMCEEQKCMEDGEWKPTGTRLTECDDGGIFCMDYTSGAVVGYGSLMSYNGFDYKCADMDWEKTGPSTDAPGYGYAASAPPPPPPKKVSDANSEKVLPPSLPRVLPPSLSKL